MTDDEAVAFLLALVDLSSYTNHESDAVTFMTDTMALNGLETEIDACGNGIGRTAGSGGPVILFLGHIDTAPGSVPVRIEGNSIFGRGSVDAKGPLATAVAAASRARDSAGITVVGAVGEEGPSRGARHLLNGPAPDALIIGEPGGAESIVLGYKGSMRATITLEQPSAHTAGPVPGVCDTAVSCWLSVQQACAALTSAEGEFGRVSAALVQFNSSNDGLIQTAELKASFRLPPNVTINDVRSAVMDAASPGTVHFEHGDPAFLARKDTALVAGFMRAIRAENLRPRFKVKSGTSDMNVVAPVWRCPTVAYGPGDSSLDHTPDEHIVIDEYLAGIRVLTRIFTEWA